MLYAGQLVKNEFSQSLKCRWLVSECELEDRWGSVIVSCCCEKVVAEAVTVREPIGRGKSEVGSRYQKTEDTAG
jgi:hypothetical protein